MLIRRLVLENFGLYGGRHEFDLTPRIKYRRTRPIVLIGGKNGAGKTTILEAIQLALYGLSSLGSRVRQVDYDTYLRGRIHRTRGDLLPVRHASVALEFEHVRLGQSKVYYAERSWQPRGKLGAEESFLLLEDGKPIEDLDAEAAETFAREIVPKGLSQLFFFDGEKIRELAEDDTGEEELARSIKSLLGLDLVERLNADLSVYASRKAGELAENDERKKLKFLLRRLTELEKQRDEYDDQIAEKQTQIDGVEGNIATVEDELRGEGQVFANQREELKVRRAALRAQIQHGEVEVRRHCESIFPFALCPRTLNRLVSIIDTIETASVGEQTRHSLAKLRKDLLKSIKASKPPSVDRTKAGAAAFQAALEATKEFLDSRSVKTNKSKAAMLPTDLSQGQRQEVLGWLTRTQSDSKPAVRELCSQLQAAQTELDDAERQLNLIPAEDSVAPILEKLHQLNQRFGALQAEQKQLQEQCEAAKLQHAEVDRQRIKLEDKIGARDDVAEKIGRTKRVQRALDEYLERLTDRKINDLRHAVVECFNRLARKGDVLKDIRINPKTFRVDLFDRHDTKIPRTELSSGEKQIYAISMLWGLARTSGRPLPVIIDTPLGRLDSDHRLNLCRNYFPHASHQVVLLSTDTEVDQTLFKELSPNISHSYHLEFDLDQVRTDAIEAYFWRDPAHV